MNEPVDLTADAAACIGTAPAICDGCCGAKVAANACVDQVWTCTATGGNACALCDAGGGDSGVDDASGDSAALDGAGACIDFDLSTYDKSCQQDSDCINVNAGMICNRGCMCGGYAINADADAPYNAAFSAAVASLPPGMSCSCPALGGPHCIQEQCVYCPNPALNSGSPIPLGCPDGG